MKYFVHAYWFFKNVLKEEKNSIFTKKNTVLRAIQFKII